MSTLWEGAGLRVYLGNKMTGIQFFNAPWFDKSAETLLSLPSVTEVFNPAEHDRKMGFEPLSCPNGSSEESRAAGFDARLALAADYAWICEFSNALVIGPQWRESPGTISEIAVHQALRLPVWEFSIFCAYWNRSDLYGMKLPPIMELSEGPKPKFRTLTPWRPWEKYLWTRTS